MATARLVTPQSTGLAGRAPNPLVATGLLLAQAFSLEFANPLGLLGLEPFPFLAGEGLVACLAGSACIMRASANRRGFEARG